MERTSELSLVERVALTRLSRFERLADAADEGGSPLWRALARSAARAAVRDCMLATLLEAGPPDAIRPAA